MCLAYDPFVHCNKRADMSKNQRYLRIEFFLSRVWKHDWFKLRYCKNITYDIIAKNRSRSCECIKELWERGEGRGGEIVLSHDLSSFSAFVIAIERDTSVRTYLWYRARNGIVSINARMGMKKRSQFSGREEKSKGATQTSGSDSKKKSPSLPCRIYSSILEESIDCLRRLTTLVFSWFNNFVNVSVLYILYRFWVFHRTGILFNL